jgi:hypothetical protein
VVGPERQRDAAQQLVDRHLAVAVAVAGAGLRHDELRRRDLGGVFGEDAHAVRTVLGVQRDRKLRREVPNTPLSVDATSVSSK